MMIYNRVLRGGLWLSRRKKWLPLTFIIAACLAILIATPYSIVHNRPLLTIACSLIALLGLWVRCVAGIRPSTDLKQTIASGGIYSVIRFPYYLADMLLLLSLTLYTGVVWFILMMLPLGYFILERIMLSEENSLMNRYTDTYRGWCKETNAIIPAILNLSHSQCKIPFLLLLRRESRVVLVTVIAFCLINLMKHVAVDFSFNIGAGWLLTLAIAATIFVIGRLSPRSK